MIVAMQDQRKHTRQKVHVDGKITSPDMTFCVDCVMKDVSEGGALVSTLDNAEGMPDRIYLWQSKTGTVFECEVRWRKFNLVGLKFIDVCGHTKSRHLIDSVTPNASASHIDCPQSSFATRA